MAGYGKQHCLRDLVCLKVFFSSFISSFPLLFLPVRLKHLYSDHANRETEGRSSSLFARVLYCGQPIETIHGTLDWLPLESLIAILQPYVPTDIESLCNA